MSKMIETDYPWYGYDDNEYFRTFSTGSMTTLDDDEDEEKEEKEKPFRFGFALPEEDASDS